jgi:uncharacterized protein YyaL (SSP411 family)
VDREERPDVDRVYMLFVQATTRSGGWPMSVWLTPDLEPFYGGTYFPPTTRWGRPGFIEILEEIGRVWRDDPDRVRRSAQQLTAQLKQFTAGTRTRPGVRRGGDEALRRAVAALQQDFDGAYGGFGGAPKFPRPSELFLLLREFARRGDEAARDMAVATLRAMARGGIHDHVGGGFHRYSVDARWHVPHFEKMLYDQAQLALAYLEAVQVVGGTSAADGAGEAGRADEVDFAAVAADILNYVSRDLARPGGGFFSAEDADSVPPQATHDTRDQAPGTSTLRLAGEGDARSGQARDQEPGTRTADQGPGTSDDGIHPVEGAFYVWTDAEFGQVLGPAADAVRRRYGVRSNGNVATDPHGEFEGKNVVYLASTTDDLAASLGQPVGEVRAFLDDATRRLFEARGRRPRPGLDDKVVVAWNGLMIGAFARASRVLRARDLPGGQALGNNNDWLRSARDAASFVRTTLWDETSGTLLRRYRGGEAGIEAYAEDFACLIFGLLELFQADGDSGWLEWAVALQRRQDELFWDDSQGGWFGTSGRDPSVLLRLKEDYDGAEPAASSISVWNLLVLARITGDEQWGSRVDRTLAAFATQMEQTPRAMPMMLAALSCSLAPKQEVVIVGGDEEGADVLFDALASRYLPFAVTIPLRSDERSAPRRLLPFTEAMTMREGRATAYVCRDFACSQPTTDPAKMLNQLASAG